MKSLSFGLQKGGGGIRTKTTNFTNILAPYSTEQSLNHRASNTRHTMDGIVLAATNNPVNEEGGKYRELVTGEVMLQILVKEKKNRAPNLACKQV